MTNRKSTSSAKGCLPFIGRGFGFLMLLIFLILGCYILLRGAGAYLIIADELKPSEAIVMLSGSDETRMREALSLYSDKYGKVIVLTETGRKLKNSEILHSNDVRIQLINNGIPSGNIFITNINVSSTLDEAFAIKELLTNQQFSSAIIVTDPYHIRRTALVFRDVFKDSPIELIFRPVRGSWFTSRTWFLSIEGWKFLVLEYIKILGFHLGIREG